MRSINKVPVIDARRPASITIRPLDVKRGRGLNPGKCAAARACLRDMHAIQARVHVGRTYVELPVKLAKQYGARAKNKTRGPVWVRFRTPPALRTEIVTFDRAKQFDPGDYTLPPPQPSHRARGKSYGGKQAKKRKRTGGYKRPTPRHVLGGVRHFEPKELRG
jgi:hypothetical protein